MRLLLACRKALFESTWEQILNGCQRYKAYCQASGREGTEFVLKPQKFIEDGCYLEEYEYKAPEDPKIIEARQKEQTRWAEARLLASRLDPVLEPMQHECISAFETRVRFAAADGRNHAPATVGSNVRFDEARARISSLTDRMRIAK
jgi:hypothetical protein